MNKPEDYISGEALEHCYDWADDVLDAIKEAQKDAYNQAIDDAINNADVEVLGYNNYEINKQSILKLKIK